jgi:hypothetical protein
MRSLISVTLLMLVLSIFAAARPLKQAKVMRGGNYYGRDDNPPNHKPSMT